MHKGRLEAFSDGVIAIIITIMVLELKVPHGADLRRLAPLVPVFLSYVLSFIYLGIYWNNHHHLLQAASHVNGARPVGEPAPALLALADPVRDRLDGREPLRHAAGRRLRLRPADGRARLLRPRAGADRRAGRTIRDSKMAVGAEIKGWISVAIYVVGILAALFVDAVGLARALCACRADVAHPRPADRTGAVAGMTVSERPVPLAEKAGLAAMLQDYIAEMARVRARRPSRAGLSPPRPLLDRTGRPLAVLAEGRR